MTEKDTFNRLRRIPYQEMMKLVTKEHFVDDWPARQEEFFRLLETNGWNYAEYHQAVEDDYYNRIRSYD
jgi:hypothetical protein